jgi:hypothetical protein
MTHLMAVFSLDLEVDDRLLTFFVEDESVDDALHAIQTSEGNVSFVASCILIDYIFVSFC